MLEQYLRSCYQYGSQPGIKYISDAEGYSAQKENHCFYSVCLLLDIATLSAEGFKASVEQTLHGFITGWIGVQSAMNIHMWIMPWWLAVKDCFGFITAHAHKLS